MAQSVHPKLPKISVNSTSARETENPSGQSHIENLIELLHPVHKHRYSTNGPQTNWAQFSKSSSALSGFIQKQQRQLNELSSFLETSDKNFAQVSELMGAYASDLFDLMGYSVSTSSLEGLAQRNNTIDTHSPFEDTLRKAYQADYARIISAGGSQSVINLLQATKRLTPEKNLVLSTGEEHTSFFGGNIAAGLKHKCISRDIFEDSGFEDLDFEEELIQQIEAHASECLAVFITFPTYHGASKDLKRIYKLCQSKDIKLLIDGAWSGLWGIHPSFPPSLAKNCDAICISLHKMGLAPCQISTLLFNNPNLVRAYDEIANLGFVTTSANNLLIAVAEHRFNDLINTRRILPWQKAIHTCTEVAYRLHEINPELEYLDTSHLKADHISPNVLTILTGKLPINANEWADLLSTQYNRDIEVSSKNSLCFIFTPGNCDDVEALILDLKLSLTSLLNTGEAPSSIAFDKPKDEKTDLTIDPNKAFYGKTKLVPLEKANGLVASSLGTITPPCQKLWGYGDIITDSHINIIKSCLNSNTSIQGIEFQNDQAFIRVCDSTEPYRTIETLKTPLHDDDFADEMVDMLLGGWAGPPYNHGFIHENAVDEPKSPAEYLQSINHSGPIEEKDWYSAEEVLSLPLLPGWHRIVDRDVYLHHLKKRMMDTGYITIVRNISGELVGILHCRSDITVEHAAETEEWLYANMMCTTLPSPKGDKSHLFEKLKYHLNLSPRHKINAICTQILHPEYRGTSTFYDMMQSLNETIEPKHARLPLVCELSEEGSTARCVNEAVMDKVLYDVLPPENGHCLGYSERFSNAFFYYAGNKSHWRYVVKEQKKKQSRPYYPHAEDHPNIEVKKIDKTKGLGVFSNSNGIKKGETIARFVGETYKSDKASTLHPAMVDHAIQVSEDEFVFGQYGIAHLINSSHAPNLGILDKTALFALRDIEAGEELAWSYEMSEDNDWKLTPCLCGAQECSGYIGAFSDLPESLKQKYLDEGIASDWILEKYKPVSR